MKETIYTIPINEAFEAHDGCPLCRLARKLEDDSLDYIMGAAMMEPDVRIEINKQGFCGEHYRRMLGLNRRLSLALTLESRIGELRRYLEKDSVKSLTHSLDTAKASQLMHEASDGCFVCNRIASVEEQYYKNLLHMWKSDEKFRDLFAAQPFFCLRHTSALLERAPGALGKKLSQEFDKVLVEVVDKKLRELNENVSAFCKSFDYRSAGKALTDDERTAVERSIEVLSGYKETVKE